MSSVPVVPWNCATATTGRHPQTSLRILEANSPPPTIFYITHTLSSFIDLDELPTLSQLEHIRELNSSDISETEDADDQTVPPLPVLICDGLPPVPARLVNRIRQGLFVEMAKLLPDYLRSADANVWDCRANNKHKLSELDNIMDWIKCFSI